MRYAYCDLGNQPEGSIVRVRWRGGSSADVMLLDPVNFTKYREGTGPVVYGDGGRSSRGPAQLTIPEEGRWYVVADLRSYGQLTEATVEVIHPQADEQPHSERLITAA